MTVSDQIFLQRVYRRPDAGLSDSEFYRALSDHEGAVGSPRALLEAPAPMTPALTKAFGYQGNPMTLPVPNLEAALPFYQSVLGFSLVSRAATPHPAAVLTRDAVQIGLAENGGDPTQDGCAFQVTGLERLFTELQSRMMGKQLSPIDTEHRDGIPWNVFYVVAPDGLCFWFGERQVP